MAAMASLWWLWLIFTVLFGGLAVSGVGAPNPYKSSNVAEFFVKAGRVSAIYFLFAVPAAFSALLLLASGVCALILNLMG